MKILITGIHGFIGTNLVKCLRGSHIIYGLDIIDSDSDGIVRTYSWNELDLLPEVDAIIHLAGKAHDLNKVNAEDYFIVNTELTRTIFTVFLNSKAEKFIFFSTVKAVAGFADDGNITEYSVPFPRDPYGLSKYMAECYISSTVVPDKAVYILRSCMIHGPGNKGNLNLLYNFQKKNLPWPLGSFENERSFCSIENVLFVVDRLLSCNVKPGIYNVADDLPISTNEIIFLIAQALNIRCKVWKISPRIIRIFAKFGDMLNLPLNSRSLSKLTESYIVSNLKIKLALGIEKMPVDAVDGIRKSLSTFI